VRAAPGGAQRKPRRARRPAPAPSPPAPCPRRHHARPGGVTGSARSRPATQPRALAGHTERRPGAMSHEAARQQLPAAGPGGLQPCRRLLRPPRRPRQPGACPRSGPRTALPPAPRPSPAACARRLIPAPRLGGCCAQRWVWPRALCTAVPAGPYGGKRRAPRSVHSGHVPGLAFPCLSVCLSTLLIPKPPFSFTLGSPFLLHSSQKLVAMTVVQLGGV
jgi:hypothetical protein